MKLPFDFIFQGMIRTDVCAAVLNSFRQRIIQGQQIFWDNRREYAALQLTALHENDVVVAYLQELDRCLSIYYDDLMSFGPTIDHIRGWCSFHRNIGGINMQFYPPGRYYREWHHERNPHNPHRTLVFMTYLNDVDQGGHTEFLYQGVRVQPKQGLTLIWPAEFTHVHRGTPTIEKKYITTGWIYPHGTSDTKPISELIDDISNRDAVD